jgi:endonuclease YncB( thermonuclease family)
MVLRGWPWLAAIVLVAPHVSPSLAHAEQPVIGYVTRVVDGDTAYVAIGSQIESVRYIGINTPEPTRPGRTDDPGGAAAREINRMLVEGRWVRLTFDTAPRDDLGRLLAYVWVDGRLVNGELLWRGYAATTPAGPNVRYADYFQALEIHARRAARGLWATVDRAEVAPLPGAKPPNSLSGAPSNVQSFGLPADAPIAKSGGAPPAPTSQAPSTPPAPRTDNASGGGMRSGGSYRSPMQR